MKFDATTRLYIVYAYKGRDRQLWLTFTEAKELAFAGHVVKLVQP